MTRPAAREGREQRRAERRVELVDAAVAAIRKRGPAVSMEDLAAEAGVTKPILYRHFGDRRGLVLAVAERFSGELLAELQAAMRQPAEPRAILVKTIDAFVAIVERDPHVYRFLVQRATTEQPDGAAALSEFLSRISDEVATVLGAQLRAAGVDSGGAEPLAHGIVGFVYSAGDWWAERRTMSRDDLVEYLASLLWSGFVGLGLGGPPGVR